jgi:hypothetical protein
MAKLVPWPSSPSSPSRLRRRKSLTSGQSSIRVVVMARLVTQAEPQKMHSRTMHLMIKIHWLRVHPRTMYLKGQKTQPQM